jgi:hypothetical protein
MYNGVIFIFVDDIPKRIFEPGKGSINRNLAQNDIELITILNRKLIKKEMSKFDFFPNHLTYFAGFLSKVDLQPGAQK